MSLQNEIREVLYNARGPLHPTIIRMQVLARRTENTTEQKLKTFTNLMNIMDDLEWVEIKGLRYWMFKAKGKHTLGYHLRGILCLITVKGLTDRLNNKITRGIKCLTTQLKILLIRLDTIKELISGCYRRLK